MNGFRVIATYSCAVYASDNQALYFKPSELHSPNHHDDLHVLGAATSTILISITYQYHIGGSVAGKDVVYVGCR